LVPVFGHYGDKVGRKTTLVIALLTMGISTVPLVLPSYASIGIAAPLLLMLCRFGQGVGLRWCGVEPCCLSRTLRLISVRLGMFPQLGAPIGFFTFWWNFDFNGYDEVPKIFWIMVGVPFIAVRY
jgi:MFS family permease